MPIGSLLHGAMQWVDWLCSLNETKREAGRAEQLRWASEESALEAEKLGFSLFWATTNGPQNNKNGSPLDFEWALSPKNDKKK